MEEEEEKVVKKTKKRKEPTIPRNQPGRGAKGDVDYKSKGEGRAPAWREKGRGIEPPEDSMFADIPFSGLPELRKKRAAVAPAVTYVSPPLPQKNVKGMRRKRVNRVPVGSR